MKYFSTFSGIGGFEIGIDNAYHSKQTAQIKQDGQGRDGSSDESDNSADGGQQPPLCVGYSEIDKYATRVYQRHFEGVKNYGDITKINADELPDFDCLVGGFPCQAFSIAGKRGGFDDTRGTLFFDLARILRAKQPRLFVFENVKGLLSHDNGKTFRTIITAIDELGYDAQWQVINSKNHGVPQNRDRVIIVGHLRGTPRPQVFPIGSDNGETANAVTSKGEIVDLTLRADNGYRTRLDGRAGTLDANYYKGIANQERPGVIQVVGMLDDETWSKRHESIRRVYGTDGIGPTLPTGTGGGVMPKILPEEPRLVRRFTPLECERLQAFPDNWTKFYEDGTAVSDTQRYKMCGNAVTTNVIQAVFERIF